MPMSKQLADVRSLIGNRLISLPSVTGIIKNAHGELLLVRNVGATEWTTPGGIIDPDERPTEAVVREMHEELGITVKPAALLGVYGGPEYQVHRPNGDKVAYITSVIACDIVEGTPTPDNEEIEAARYFNANELDKLEKPVWVIDILRNLAEQNQFN